MLVGTRRRMAGLAIAATVALQAGGCAGSTPPVSIASASAGPSGPPASRRPNDIPQPPGGPVTLNGAGATLPAPLYQVWFDRFAATYTNVSIAFDPSGSAIGIAAAGGGRLAFGATDAAMTDAELAAAPARIIHVPTALGAVSVVVNLPGVSAIQLDGATLAGIFLGRIVNWNDQAIASLNAGVTLPDLPIAVMHRSDASGATAAFTTYLDGASPDWHAGPGIGGVVAWPAGTGAAGDDGVAAAVKTTSGGIGYAGSAFASKAGLRTAKLRNAAGNFVRATSLGIGAAGETVVAGLAPDLRQGPVVAAAGVNAYPIVVPAYVLVQADQADRAVGEALIAFLGWALTSGQADAAQAGFAALPGGIQAKALAALHGITSGGTPIWP